MTASAVFFVYYLYFSGIILNIKHAIKIRIDGKNQHKTIVIFVVIFDCKLK